MLFTDTNITANPFETQHAVLSSSFSHSSFLTTQPEQQLHSNLLSGQGKLQTVQQAAMIVPQSIHQLCIFYGLLLGILMDGFVFTPILFVLNVIRLGDDTTNGQPQTPNVPVFLMIVCSIAVGVGFSSLSLFMSFLKSIFEKETRDNNNQSTKDQTVMEKTIALAESYTTVGAVVGFSLAGMRTVMITGLPAERVYFASLACLFVCAVKGVHSGHRDLEITQQQQHAQGEDDGNNDQYVRLL